MTAEPRVLSVREVAEQLRTSPGTVYGLIARGDLKAVKLGRLTRVPAVQLARFLGETETEGQS